MKRIVYTALILSCLATGAASATSILVTLDAIFAHCEFVAFVRVIQFHAIKSGLSNMSDCVITCDITHSFKNPVNESQVDIHFLNDLHSAASFDDMKLAYEGRTFLIFAFQDGKQFRPFGGESRITEMADHYWYAVKDDSGNGGFRQKYFTHEDLVKTLAEYSEETKNTQHSPPVQASPH